MFAAVLPLPLVLLSPNAPKGLRAGRSRRRRRHNASRSNRDDTLSYGIQRPSSATNVKRFDENASVTKGVKKTVATINARAKEIDRSLKISAMTNAVVGMGKDTAGMVLNKAMESKVISKTAIALSDLNTSATLKRQDVAAKSKAPVNSGEVVRTRAKRGPEYTPADRSQTRDAAEERQRACKRASKRRRGTRTSDPRNWTDEKAKSIANGWFN